MSKPFTSAARHVIDAIQPGSIAEELEIQKGDVLCAINGTSIRDFVDFQYFTSGNTFTLTIQKPDGQIIDFEIEREDWEPLGLNFHHAFMDKQMACQNKCVFCFIDQMPPGMRKTLYFKDDDWRLSLMMGNYVTLTNLSNTEFQRILDREISPLYLSIHATDPKVRQQMIANPHADILPRLRQLAKAKLPFHGQIVLCPGYNDGTVLHKTLSDLYELLPVLQSVAVVPVGMTKYRQGLAPLRSVDKSIAGQTLDILDEWNAKAIAEYGVAFAFGADELYLKSGYAFPPYEYYGDFDQIEDGIGMVVKFIREFEQAGVQQLDNEVGVITGTLFAPVLTDLLHKWQAQTVSVFPIINQFFGPAITVAGLVTGGDIIDQLKNKALPKRLLLPDVMLKHGENRFLDDVSVEQVEQALGRKIQVTGSSGQDFARAIQRED